MNTRPSLVLIQNIQVIAPIHGIDGPCVTTLHSRLMDALQLYRFLPGATLQFVDKFFVNYRFNSTPLQFIDPLVQESEEGYDLTATLLTLEARVLLGHYKTQAAVDAAYEALLDYAAWDPAASPDQTVPQGEGVEFEGEEPEQVCDSYDISRKVKVEDLRLHFAHPEVRINALEEIDAALRGIFYVYPGLQGMANHGLAYDYLHVLLEQERARAYKPANPETIADISVGLNHRRAVELHQLYHQYRDLLPTGFASELDALLAPIHEWDAGQKVRQARCRKAKGSHVAKGRANDGPNS